MATKRLKKKQIKEDRLVTLALTISRIVQDHFTKVVAGIVVLVAAVAVILFTAQARRNTAQEAEREFSLAMNQYQVSPDKETAAASFANVADRFSGHRVGVLALYFLGECQLEAGRYNEAVSSYDRYLERAGDRAQFRIAATIGKGMSYQGMGDIVRAAEILTEASAAMGANDPRRPDVLFNAASFYESAGEEERAIELFREVRDTGSGALKSRATMRLSLLE